MHESNISNEHTWAATLLIPVSHEEAAAIIATGQVLITEGTPVDEIRCTRCRHHYPAGPGPCTPATDPAARE